MFDNTTTRQLIDNWLNGKLPSEKVEQKLYIRLIELEGIIGPNPNDEEALRECDLILSTLKQITEESIYE